MIKSFCVTGLFGDRDVCIPFDSNVKILVAENGSGKTTLLNALYNVVAADFTKLRGMEFQKIKVAFSTGVTVELTKEEIESSAAVFAGDPRIHQLPGRLSPLAMHELLEVMKRSGTPSMAMRSIRFRRESQRLGIQTDLLYNMIKHSQGQPEQHELLGVSLKAAREAILKSVPYQLLYFPTYRRVEEDLERLGFADLEVPTSDQLIKFGMNDVRECFEKITAEIKNSSIEWFSRINGQMLSQLVDGINITPEMRKRIGNPEALKIVLDRIGENIDQSNKDHILDLVRNNRLSESRYDPLVYFLANLIQVYDQQRENDNAIKEFTKVCNRYLEDKEVVYNETDILAII